MTNDTIEELLLVATTETIQDGDSDKTSGMPKMSGNYKIFFQEYGTVSTDLVPIFKIYFQSVRDRSRALHLQNKWFIIENLESEHPKCTVRMRSRIIQPIYIVSL